VRIPFNRLRRRRAASSGLTLVELLIVFSIVGLLVSLVSPEAYRQVERAKAQEEWLVLDRQIRAIAFDAYSQGRPVMLSLSGRELVWQFEGDAEKRWVTERLFFVANQSIRISRNGFAEPEIVRVRLGDRERDLALNRWMARE
jgi:type II secretory pathway pseudopilin PulG